MTWPRLRRDAEADRGPGPGGRFRRLSRERAEGLHARLVAREERALAELIAAATPWLLGLTQAMLSDADEAEEVIQEAFTIVWNRIDDVAREPGGLVPWLLRIARNRAVDRLRARRRARAKAARFALLGLDAEDAVVAAEPDEAGHPGWHVHRAVHAAIAGLPEPQRIVIELAYFRGLTHSEVAADLGIPLGTVKTRLRLAAEHLRAALASLKDWAL